MLPTPPVTQALLLIHTAMFCVQVLVGAPLVQWLALWPVGVGFLPWQLLTHGLVNASIFDLLFNLLGLWVFSGELVRLWGPSRLVQFWFASIFTAGLTHLALAAAMGSPVPGLGSSGGVFGLLIAYAVLFPNRTIMLVLPPIAVKVKVLVAVFAGLQLLFGVFDPAGGLSHFSQLGGTIGGFLLLQFWRRRLPFGRSR